MWWIILTWWGHKAFPSLKAQVMLSSNGLRRAVLFTGWQKGLSPISTRENLGRDHMTPSQLE